MLAPAFLAAFLGVAVALGPKEKCVEIVNAGPGGSCASLAAAYGTTLATIERLNPGIDCDAPFPGPNTTAVCTLSYTPTCEAWVTATGSTCDYLLPLYHLSKDEFVENNDNVDTNCDLVVGQEYCATTDWCVVHAADCCAFDPNSVYCGY
ncbi:hypothetical protein AURDEDRAFT_113030 [Auricularia subglabra TFB-10046 SS5]|nr:hypothetical protein AURDEDRAFT_113030 [Auricularia subglabra TFB-10046 SS5]